MARKILAAGVALAVLLPAAAQAQTTCQERSQNRVAGTALGAIAGALIGSGVAGKGHKTDGAVVGGIAGAVVGNQVAKGPKDCVHAYGWYDNSGGYHANTNVDPNTAWGYYDRRGEWVAGRPADWREADYRPGPPPMRPEWDRWDFLDGPGYPEFQRMELGIRDRIRDGVRDDRIRHDDARDLMAQLRDIRDDERRLYAAQGDRLAPDQRVRLRMRLRDLDRLVAEVRSRG